MIFKLFLLSLSLLPHVCVCQLHEQNALRAPARMIDRLAANHFHRNPGNPETTHLQTRKFGEMDALLGVGYYAVLPPCFDGNCTYVYEIVRGYTSYILAWWTNSSDIAVYFESAFGALLFISNRTDTWLVEVVEGLTATEVYAFVIENVSNKTAAFVEFEVLGNSSATTPTPTKTPTLAPTKARLPTSAPTSAPTSVLNSPLSVATRPSSHAVWAVVLLAVTAYMAYHQG